MRKKDRTFTIVVAWFFLVIGPVLGSMFLWFNSRSGWDRLLAVCALVVPFYVLRVALGGGNSRQTYSGDYLPISSHTVPEIDAEGRITAYRYFQRGDDGTLYPVGNGKNYAPDGYKGGALTSHRVPTLNNTAGIYAAKTPDSPILNPWMFMRDHVLASVELSGRVIEGEWGYRGQHCRILKILKENNRNGYR